MTADIETGTAADIDRKRYWQRKALAEKDIDRKRYWQKRY